MNNRMFSEMRPLTERAGLDSRITGGEVKSRMNHSTTSRRPSPYSTFISGLLFLICTLPLFSQNSPSDRALSLEQEHKFAEAESAWKILCGKQPSNPEPLAHLGLL